jgi:hypothetical protein
VETNLYAHVYAQLAVLGPTSPSRRARLVSIAVNGREEGLMFAGILTGLAIAAYVVVAFPLAFVLIAFGVGLVFTVLLAPLGAVMVAAGLKLLWPRM